MAYNPSEPRDKDGKWTGGGGGRGKGVSGAKRVAAQQRLSQLGKPLPLRLQIAVNRSFSTNQPRGVVDTPNKVTILGGAPRSVHVVNPDNVSARHGSGSHSMSRAKPLGSASRNAIVPTYSIAMAAGKDAANASMRKAGRTSWNATDHDVAAKTVNRLLGAPTRRRG